jgi:hypothetical protein
VPLVSNDWFKVVSGGFVTRENRLALNKLRQMVRYYERPNSWVRNAHFKLKNGSQVDIDDVDNVKELSRKGQITACCAEGALLKACQFDQDSDSFLAASNVLESFANDRGYSTYQGWNDSQRDKRSVVRGLNSLIRQLSSES